MRRCTKTPQSSKSSSNLSLSPPRSSTFLELPEREAAPEATFGHGGGNTTPRGHGGGRGKVAVRADPPFGYAERSAERLQLLLFSADPMCWSSGRAFPARRLPARSKRSSSNASQLYLGESCKWKRFCVVVYCTGSSSRRKVCKHMETEGKHLRWFPFQDLTKARFRQTTPICE